MSAEEKTKRKEYIHILTRAKTRMVDQKITYAIVGEYDSKMVALDLAANHDINMNQKPESEQNWAITFQDATKTKDKQKSDKNAEESG